MNAIENLIEHLASDISLMRKNFTKVKAQEQIFNTLAAIEATIENEYPINTAKRRVMAKIEQVFLMQTPVPIRKFENIYKSVKKYLVAVEKQKTLDDPKLLQRIADIGIIPKHEKITTESVSQRFDDKEKFDMWLEKYLDRKIIEKKNSSIEGKDYGTDIVMRRNAFIELRRKTRYWIRAGYEELLVNFLNMLTGNPIAIKPVPVKKEILALEDDLVLEEEQDDLEDVFVRGLMKIILSCIDSEVSVATPAKKEITSDPVNKEKSSVPIESVPRERINPLTGTLIGTIL